MGKIGKATTITFAFQKGGIAKTTSSSNLAAGLKKIGYKVLVIDADTQCSLTRISGVEMSKKTKTITEVLQGKCPAKEAVLHLNSYDIIPAKQSLIAFQDTMPSIPNKEFLFLRTIMKELADEYDYIIFDTNASFSDLAKCAIVAADKVIIPMIADEQSYSSLPQQISTINVLNEGFAGWIPPTEIGGILITMYHPNYNVDKKYNERIQKYAESKEIPIYNTHIRFSTAIKEAQSERKNIFEAKADSPVATDYFDFIEEFLMNQKKEKEQKENGEK